MNQHNKETYIPPSASYEDIARTAIDAYYLPLSTDPSTAIVRFDDESAAVYAASLYQHKMNNFSQRFPNIIATTPERAEMERRAREFVKDTIGVAPVGTVHWQADVIGGFRGHYANDYKSTFIRERNYGPDELQRMSDITTIVHELAHSTGDRHHGAIFFKVEPSGRLEYTFPCSNMLGQNLLKIEKEEGEHVVHGTGDFFEEAFAEETAARYRDSVIPDDAARMQHFDTDDVTIPTRYINSNYVATKNGEDADFELGLPAFAAYSVAILSQASGLDLYELQCRMRVPEQKAEAKKQFITAIDSVQKGLYRQLRDLAYPGDDFLEGLRLVEKICDKY